MRRRRRPTRRRCWAPVGVEPGEVKDRFSDWFVIERLGQTDLGTWFEPRAVTYLLS